MLLKLPLLSLQLLLLLLVPHRVLREHLSLMHCCRWHHPQLSSNSQQVETLTMPHQVLLLLSVPVAARVAATARRQGCYRFLHQQLQRLVVDEWRALEEQCRRNWYRPHEHQSDAP